MKKLLLAVILIGLLIGLSGNRADADQELMGADGRPTGFVYDDDGNLRRKVDGLVVKFACSPANMLGSDEVEATRFGAPMCPDMLKATIWYCVSNSTLPSDQKETTSNSDGHPYCGENYTAVRQRIFAPLAVPMAPRQLPAINPIERKPITLEEVE